MSEPNLTVECDVHFRHGRTGRRELILAPAPANVPTGRVPRVARLLAWAIKFEWLIRSRVVANYAELARLGPRHHGAGHAGDEPALAST